MTREDSLSLVQKLYAAFGSADLPRILNILSDDVDWDHVGPKQIPICGARRGREAVTNFFITIATEEEVKAFELRDFIVDEGKVAAFGYEDLIIRKTSNRYAGEFMHVWWMSNGKITKYRGFCDVHALLAAYTA